MNLLPLEAGLGVEVDIVVAAVEDDLVATRRSCSCRKLVHNPALIVHLISMAVMPPLHLRRVLLGSGLPIHLHGDGCNYQHALNTPAICMSQRPIHRLVDVMTLPSVPLQITGSQDSVQNVHNGATHTAATSAPEAEPRAAVTGVDHHILDVPDAAAAPVELELDQERAGGHDSCRVAVCAMFGELAAEPDVDMSEGHAVACCQSRLHARL